MSQTSNEHGRWDHTSRRHSGRSTVDRGPANVVRSGGGPYNFDHASTYSTSTSSPPVGALTPQGHEILRAIPQSQSTSHLSGYLLTPSDQASPHRHHTRSGPSQLPQDYPLAWGPRSRLTPSASGQSGPSEFINRPTQVPNLFLPESGDSPPQFLQIPHPGRPSRSEDNVLESLHSTRPSVPYSGDLARQHSYQSLPPAGPPSQLYDHTVAVPRTQETTASFLTGASGFRMRDIHYHEAPHPPAERGDPGAGGSSIDGWEQLLQKTAPNALHNSKARFDPPKCDEDTRVEVTSELMEWLQDRSAPQRLLCMTGAAGSGKSCLQQTAAEKCGSSNILAASFFLSAQDATRNTIDPIIPTIAYQLGRENSTLKRFIKTAIEKDSLIFHQSLVAQMTALIVRPVEDLGATGADLKSLPYVILIDGLDEAKGEDRQAELLTAIRQCLLTPDLPFRIFIASRPEWAIYTALQPGGHLRDMAYRIQLSDKYNASADMRRYLQRRFEAIGVRINDPHWFSQANIETLVKAGSGQFIYVATVYKYISARRTTPRARLDAVLTWTPREGQTIRPFEALDVLYHSILSDAKEAYEAVDTHEGRDFVLLFRVYHVNIGGFQTSGTTSQYPEDLLSVLLCSEAQAEETLISDLRSLVALKMDERGKTRLHLYHKSFSDFLEEPSRAKDLFVPESRVYVHLAKCMMRYIIECPLNFNSLPTKWEDVSLSELHRHCLWCAVRDLPRFLANRMVTALDDEVVGFTQKGGWQKVDKVFLLVRKAYPIPRSWLPSIHRVSDMVKDRDPEAAAVIKKLSTKWEQCLKRMRGY